MRMRMHYKDEVEKRNIIHIVEGKMKWDVNNK